jgi:hypothetical protein
MASVSNSSMWKGEKSSLTIAFPLLCLSAISSDPSDTYISTYSIHDLLNLQYDHTPPRHRFYTTNQISTSNTTHELNVPLCDYLDGNHLKPKYRFKPQPIYSTLFKRNSIFVTTVFLSAFSFSIGFDLATTAYWDYHNKGVSVFDFLGCLKSETVGILRSL